MAFVGLVSLVLLASGLSETYFQYEDRKAVLVASQGDKAVGAAEKIKAFVDAIESRLAQSFPVGSADSITLADRREEYLRLLREVPAVSTVQYIDRDGRERIRLSRIAINLVGTGADLAGDPLFRVARSAGTYYSPVSFRLSEPYLEIAVAEAHSGDGVAAVEVNLKLILEVVESVTVGASGYAYVVDQRGQLIAHPDISMVLRRPDVSQLPQVAARSKPTGSAGAPTIGRNLGGEQVLTAHETIPSLGWTVFVDEPLSEAFAPVYTALGRNLALLGLGLVLSLGASLMLAETMVRPIRALREGAANVASGHLGERIRISSGDELEALADEFNGMTAELEASYQDLEHKVADRTSELALALEALRASDERLRTVMTNVPLALLAIDRGLTIELAEGRGLGALGRATSSLVGRSVHALCGEDHAICAVIERAMAGTPVNATVEVGGRPFDLQCAPIHADSGEVTEVIAVAVDVSERVRAEAVMRQQSEVYEPLLKAQSDLGEVIAIFEGTRLLYANEALTHITGRPAEELREIAAIEAIVEPDDRAVFREALLSRRSGVNVEVAIRMPDGERAELEVAVERYQSGDAERIVVVARDVTERKRAERALEHQALHDLLTGLPNRTLLQDRAEYAIATARRAGSPVSLLLMDLDHFKEVNDTFGHAAGDTLLRQVGERIVGSIRESDTVARLGGDEFAVLLPGTSADDARRVAQTVLTALERPILIEGHALGISASVGIATSPEHGLNPSTLLRNADIAMYVAKRAMSGTSVYERANEQRSADRLALTADLRLAIENRSLALHFQPLLDLRTERIVGVEALARWPHATHGFVPPSDFIPLAEQTGLIKPLTDWVIGVALQRRQELRERGHDIGVSVNLSVRSLLDTGLPAVVAELLTRWHDRPENLTLEITESVLMAEPDRAVHILSRLREMGVRLALDDYGTGYASLAYLRRLPLDILKIDRSFIAGLTTDEGSSAIVRSTIELGHSLGFRVVAEGVESSAALAKLREFGCDEIQGYYVSPALPVDELGYWLEARTWADKTTLVSPARLR
jgi:diguanylate cyclase (GGDEF)-like protein/PAS domain S-box-containing protein